MKVWKGCCLLVLLALLVSLSGCCCGGGSDTETKIIEKQPVSTAPLGEELIKLQEARDKGALSEKEYEDAKARLLKQQ
jgi:hypothetical protein